MTIPFGAAAEEGAHLVPFGRAAQDASHSDLSSWSLLEGGL